MILNRRAALSLTLGAAALAATPARASTPPVYAVRGIALGGTDTVAYFTDSRPVAGKAKHSADWNGATWHFASAENRDTFLADPTAFAPQYGGYCAWAVSRGYTASTVPEAWEIVDGKLYRNFSLGVRSRWRRDIPSNIAKGDANWPGVLA
ncbi:MAG: YHS domain-containing (seleno)protein [Pseudomonadota bacterium]